MTKVTQAHIEARTAAIREAAIRLFVAKGVEGARMEDIAAEAGLSAGAIYRYYPSKEHLLRAVLTDCVAYERALLVQAGTDVSSPVETLIAAGRVLWEELKSPQSRERTILGLESTLAGLRHAEEIRHQRRQTREDTITWLAQFLGQAQATGELDPKIDPTALAVILHACISGLRILALDLEDRLDLDAALAVLIEMLRRFAPAAD